MRIILHCLLIAACAAAARAEDDDAPHRERWTFTRAWSLENQPEKNAFSTVGEGEVSIHDGRLFEQHRSETRLKKAKMKGLPLPLPMVPANMRVWPLYAPAGTMKGYRLCASNWPMQRGWTKT